MRLFLMIIFATACGLYAQDTSKVIKTTAAVLDFKALTVMKKEEVISLTNKFRSSLAQTKKFILLERSDMDAILKEQDFSMTDICNTAECAVQVGQLLAAEKMITGDLGKVGQAYTVTVRIIDVSTGKVEATASDEYRGASEGLIQTFDLLAQKLAGTYRSKIRAWLWVTAAVLAGGGASALLLLSKSGAKPITIGNPPGDPQLP